MLQVKLGKVSFAFLQCLPGKELILYLRNAVELIGMTAFFGTQEFLFEIFEAFNLFCLLGLYSTGKRRISFCSHIA